MNLQEPLQRDYRDDRKLLLHSTFRTIQGEGPFAGHGALFLRLYGCNLQCPWCDTEYTSKQKLVTPELVVQIIRTFYDWQSGLVVITGGEPFRQNIEPLVGHLLAEGYIVQIETNGVLYPGDHFPWQHPNLTVVCSPKTGKIHPDTAVRVHAYKYVLQAGKVAPDGLPEQALGHPLGRASHVARPPVGWDGPVYVQPMDEMDTGRNKANLEAVVQTIYKHPDKNYIAGVQMHKLMRLP